MKKQAKHNFCDISFLEEQSWYLINKLLIKCKTTNQLTVRTDCLSLRINRTRITLYATYENMKA